MCGLKENFFCYNIKDVMFIDLMWLMFINDNL